MPPRGDLFIIATPPGSVRGETLRQRLEHGGPLPVAQAVAKVRSIAFALAYAHRQGVVHRDIKPENILIHEGEPVIADFGIARVLAAAEDPRLTEMGLAIGTPDYTSPEQVAGDADLDGRSDIYSLGCVLFELLAGQPPFTDRGRAALARRLIETAPRVRSLRVEVGPILDTTLARALALDPADRFPTAGAFAEALGAKESDRPRTPVVAVLPFRNLSSDPESAYFADGVTEDVIAHLSKVRTLDVIARASVMPFKGTSQDLRGHLRDPERRRPPDRDRPAGRTDGGRAFPHQGPPHR